MKNLRLLISIFAGIAFSCTGAHADEVRVLAAGAAKHALERIAPAFERETGHRIVASYDTVGAQRDRVLHGAPGAVADVVILSDPALDRLDQAQQLAVVPRATIGRVVVALAVPADAPAPDISTSGKLRAALLAAQSIAYADPARGATAGSHFATVLDALGLREALQGRITVLPVGLDVITGVAQKRFALGVSQSSEILQHEGVKLAGGLPAPYELATPYAAAMTRDTPVARALLEYLGGRNARDAWRASGFLDPP